MSKKRTRLTDLQRHEITKHFSPFGGNCWVRRGDDNLYTDAETLAIVATMERMRLRILT